MKVTSFEIGEFYTIRYPMKEWFDAFYESPAFNESPINDKGISMKGLTQVACVQVIGWNKKTNVLHVLWKPGPSELELNADLIFSAKRET